MFVTIVEGTVAAVQEPDLRTAWEEVTASALPAGLIESSLLRTEDGIRRIVTVWESKEAVMAMRATGEPPAALVVFERAGAKPSVSMSMVEGRVESRRRDPQPVDASGQQVTLLGHAESYAARIANQTTDGEVVVSPARARTPRADGRVRLRRAARR